MSPVPPLLDFYLAFWLALCIGTLVTNLKSTSHEHQRTPYLDDLEERRLGQGRSCSTANAVRVRQLQKVTLLCKTQKKRKKKKYKERPHHTPLIKHSIIKLPVIILFDRPFFFLSLSLFSHSRWPESLNKFEKKWWIEQWFE